MFETMMQNKVAVCEAEVGTGKTHAYIIAAVVYRLFYKSSQAIIVSTSTIALQKAIVGEYVPQISRILLENQIITAPLRCAVRKGKTHYVCDSRLKTFLLSLIHNNRIEDRELIDMLGGMLKGACPIDLDILPVTRYVKKRICVGQCHYHCEFASMCWYHKFIQRTKCSDNAFQVTNHNMVLADIMNRKKGKNGLLPDRNVIIFDEAHKLLDAAREMYKISIVKLPFPIPSPASEFAKSQHNSFEEYLTDNIVPDMLMKLRQWIGRGIRQETDSCVFSILDRRAGKRYKADLLAALPRMPVTDRLSDVGKFILTHKTTNILNCRLSTSCNNLQKINYVGEKVVKRHY